jgi:hypothetical protein
MEVLGMFIENKRITRTDVNQRILASCTFQEKSKMQGWIQRLKTSCIEKRQNREFCEYRDEEHQSGDGEGRAQTANNWNGTERRQQNDRRQSNNDRRQQNGDRRQTDRAQDLNQTSSEVEPNLIIEITARRNKHADVFVQDSLNGNIRAPKPTAVSVKGRAPMSEKKETLAQEKSVIEGVFTAPNVARDRDVDLPQPPLTPEEKILNAKDEDTIGLTTQPASCLESDAQSQALLDLLSVFGSKIQAESKLHADMDLQRTVEELFSDFPTTAQIQIESGDSPRNFDDPNPHEAQGDEPMSLELTTVIMESLNDLIEEEDLALNNAIEQGTAAFEERAFEKVEVHLKEATLRKRALDIFTMLRGQWKEFSELGSCIQEWLDENDDPMHADLTVAYCSPDRRLKITTDMLMQVMQKAGARSFESMQFERAHEISRHALKLQKFQQRVDEVCGENGIKQTAARMLELVNSAA